MQVSQLFGVKIRPNRLFQIDRQLQMRLCIFPREPFIQLFQKKSLMFFGKLYASGIFGSGLVFSAFDPTQSKRADQFE